MKFKRTKDTVSTLSKGSTLQPDMMRSLGYISVPEAALRAGVHHGKIYRALDKGTLQGTVVTERRYVEWDSFVTYAGPVAGDINKPPSKESEADDAATT